jgi:hypothetical protein
MKPYGSHIEHIIGRYYSIRERNRDYDLYEIYKYDEAWDKKNTKRLIRNGCYTIEKKKEVGSKECVKLIIKETRLKKLNNIKNGNFINN